MSRISYNEDWDFDTWDLIRSCGALTSAIRGKRGQAFLRELLSALDSMPEKRLISEDLIDSTGEVCALGRVAQVRGLDVSGVPPGDSEMVAKLFGIADALARQIAFVNDDEGRNSPENRFVAVRGWVARNII